MFVKITTSAGRQYVKLVKAFRDDQGTPRQRVIATLGRLEAVRGRRYGECDTLLADFHRTTCRTATSEVVGAFEWRGYRPVIAHRPTWRPSSRRGVTP
jgi:hypothetical protein